MSPKAGWLNRTGLALLALSLLLAAAVATSPKFANGTADTSLCDSRARCFEIDRMRETERRLAAPPIAVSQRSAAVLTRPGIAESGHWIQHWLQPVHFSGRNRGTSKRMFVMSRIELVAAGIALIAANGSAMPS